MPAKGKEPLIRAVDANLYLMSGESSLHILKDINMEIQPSEVVAVTGPSGSGKTSLLMILAGLERATSGSISIAGQEMTALDEDELAVFRRNNLGILFQNFHLVPSLTALENVSLALELAEVDMKPAEIRAQAMEALEQVGLSERVHHLPSAMSGGEQQRVGLARSIVSKPQLLLADEPTGNLDQDTAEIVIELLFGLAKKNKMAVVLITHDEELAERAGRRLVMDRGQLSAHKATAK